MGHYVVSPNKGGGSSRDTDYRSGSGREMRVGGKPSGSLPSQYSRLTNHHRSFSGSFDRNPCSRPSSLYETRAMRSFDSQTPSGHHAVVHQLTIRPNVEEPRKTNSKPLGSKAARIERQGSISSLKSLNTTTSSSPSPSFTKSNKDAPKEKKGLFNLKKRLSASLSSLVSTLGSLSYSMQDLSSSSAMDMHPPSTPSPSLQRLNGAFDDDSDSDEDEEYSDSVSLYELL